jgi:hypothetical protein
VGRRGRRKLDGVPPSSSRQTSGGRGPRTSHHSNSSRSSAASTAVTKRRNGQIGGVAAPHAHHGVTDYTGAAPNITAPVTRRHSASGSMHGPPVHASCSRSPPVGSGGGRGADSATSDVGNALAVDGAHVALQHKHHQPPPPQRDLVALRQVPHSPRHTLSAVALLLTA